MAKESPQERAARLKKERAAQQRAERKRNIMMVASVAAVMVAIVVGGFAISKLTNTEPKDTEVSASVGAVTIGPDSAPHKVIIYEDFLCPYCGELERASRADLEKLADEGKVQVTYRPFDLLKTDYSRTTSEVFQSLVRDSSAEVTKKFHDMLFENQPSESGDYPSEADVIEVAVQAGASKADIEANLAGRANQWANEADAGAAQAGVQSTPTILLDGKAFTSGRTVDELVEGLLKALA